MSHLNGTVVAVVRVTVAAAAAAAATQSQRCVCADVTVRGIRANAHARRCARLIQRRPSAEHWAAAAPANSGVTRSNKVNTLDESDVQSLSTDAYTYMYMYFTPQN